VRPSLLFAYGCACGVSAALIWGGGAVVSRHLVTQGYAPVDLAALRYLGCLPIAVAVLGRHGWQWMCAGLSWQQIAVLVGLAGPPYHLLVIAGYKHATSGGGALLISGLLPVYALALTCVTRRCAPRSVHIIGVGAVITGLVLLAFPATGTADFPLLIGPIGFALFATAALSWAVLNHLIRAWRVAPMRLTLLLAVTSPAFFPVYLSVRPDSPFSIPLGAAAVQIVYHGVLVGMVGTFLFLEAVTHVGAHRAGNMQALSPVFAVGLGALLLAETIPATAAVAMVAIVVGIIAAAPPWTRR
jgi:drug/metabolite transporter (DMT)-like permease